MMYCLKKKKKLCLPFIILHYMKEAITETRTTATGENKRIPRYVPVGRIITDTLLESGLVQDLIRAQCTEDLAATTGEVLDARNLKKMGVLEKVKVDPVPEDPKEALKRRMIVDEYPVWTKHDDPEVLALYIFSLEQEGYDTSTWTYDDFPGCPPDMLTTKKRKSQKRKSEEEKSKQKKSKKPK